MTAVGILSLEAPAPPGQTLFVPQADGTLRVGTCEGLDADTKQHLISFPAPRRGRRSPPQTFERNAFLTPEEIGPTYELYPEGAQLVLSLGSALFRVVRTLRPQTEGDSTLPVVAVHRAADGTWALGEPLGEVPRDDLFSAPYLAALEHWRYFHPVHPHYDILTSPIGVHSEFPVSTQVIFGTQRLPINGSLQIDGLGIKFDGTVPFEIAARMDTETARALDRGEASFSANGAVIRISNVAYMGSEYKHVAGEVPKPGKVTLAIPHVRVQFRLGSPLFTRETYEGVKLHYCHKIWRREPVPNPMLIALRLPTAGECIETTVFGRPAIIYEPPAMTGSDNTYVSVLYHGAPLSAMRRRALSALIGYLAGGRAKHISQEAFDIDGRLSIDIAERGSTKIGIMPVPLDYPGRGPAVVAAQIPTMLDAMYREIRRDPRGIEAALHHYAEGVANTYPTKAIGDLSIAIDALIASYTDDDQSNAAIIDADTFKVLRKLLTRAFADAIADNVVSGLTVKQRERLQSKIDQINTASNTKRFERFWGELRVRLKKRDVKILRKRHPAVHRGYPEDESGRRALLRSYRHARWLANLFNRAFLRMLHYEGPVLDALSNERGWITIDRGSAFKAVTAHSIKGTTQ